MKTSLACRSRPGAGCSGTAAIQYFHWDKPHHGDRGNVTALDLTSRKVVWEASAGKSVNFVHETGAGVIVGNDEGEVVLLDKNNGKVIWRCRLEKSAEIKTLIADTEDGFFRFVGRSVLLAGQPRRKTSPPMQRLLLDPEIDATGRLLLAPGSWISVISRTGWSSKWFPSRRGLVEAVEETDADDLDEGA